MKNVEDAVVLARALKLLLDGHDVQARAELLKLSNSDPIMRPLVDAKKAEERPSHAPRLPTKPSLLAPVLQRDGWRCHYCGRKLVVAGVIELVGYLCPNEFPFPSGHHMPTAHTHPAAIRVYPNVDHVLAGSLGGDWQDPRNLVAACTPCNERKSDRLGWTSAVHERDQWNGLTECYRPLVEFSGNIRPYHAAWLQALGL